MSYKSFLRPRWAKWTYALSIPLFCILFKEWFALVIAIILALEIMLSNELSIIFNEYRRTTKELSGRNEDYNIMIYDLAQCLQRQDCESALKVMHFHLASMRQVREEKDRKLEDSK